MSSAALVIDIISVVLAVIATILAWIFLLPEKKVKTLNKFWYTVHRILNLKDLLVEKILKTLYVFSTAFCLIGGFCYLFYFEKSYGFWSSGSSYSWRGYIGLILMIVGPIVTRITYELLMAFFILVKNTQDIRNKVCDDGKREEIDNAEPAYVPNYVFCQQCGQRYDSNSGPCPYCATNQQQAQYYNNYYTQQ